MKNGKNGFAAFLRRHTQLLVPLVPLTILIIFNLIKNPAFLNIWMSETGIYSGYPISILYNGTTLVIMALGMTLVTAASGGQDISVGALAAIASATFFRVLVGGDVENSGRFILAIFAGIGMTMVFGAFNGMLVSVFKIQPMIATLILYSCGRSFAYWIGNDDEATFTSTLATKMAVNIPGCPIKTPILICLLMFLVFFLLLKFTNIGLYAQAVGINQDAAKLNGINATMVKWLVFVILGACCAISGMIRACEVTKVSYEQQMIDIEMKAILAVALGGNSLGGGKYSIVGSVLGAYTLTTLEITLDGLNIKSTDIKVYYALVIILLVVAASGPVKKLINRITAQIKSAAHKTGGPGDGAIPLAKEAQ